MGEVCWCVILCDLLAGCSFLRAWAGCWLGFCLGVFPTWCSKVGADTGSICNVIINLVLCLVVFCDCTK